MNPLKYVSNEIKVIQIKHLASLAKPSLLGGIV